LFNFLYFEYMNFLRNSVLATVVYYDVFDFPLTLMEVFKYLINPARINRIIDGIGELKVIDVAEELDKLVGSQIIEEKNGFYFLAGRSDLFNLRIKRRKIADQKWKIFLRYCRWLSLAPHLRGIFASGSMALSNTEEKSDFDVLIIARSGRLYTCRFFLWVISSVLGFRRKKWEKIAPDKLCFNHYITDDALYVPHESLFNAQSYVNLKPAMIDSELVDKFYSSNLWLNNYVYNFSVSKNFVMRNTEPNKFFLTFAKFCEAILDSVPGDLIEGILRNIQQGRIEGDPVTYQSGGRVIFTDQELEFHPHSFEVKVLERYKLGLKKAGVISYIEEKDSGLLK